MGIKDKVTKIHRILSTYNPIITAYECIAALHKLLLWLFFQLEIFCDDSRN